jgi:hypothetical protein
MCPSSNALVLFPLSAVPVCARHGCPELCSAATSPSPWRARCRTPEPYLSRAQALQELLYSVHLVFLPISKLQPRAPLPPPLLSLQRLLLVVGIHDRLPIAPTDPLTSFSNFYSSSPAPSSSPISAGAPSPTPAVRHRLLLAVDSPPQPIPAPQHPLS